MKLYFLVFFYSIFHVTSSQSCTPTKGLELIDLVLQSPIAVQALVKVPANNDKQKMFNGSAKVQRVFPTHSGNLTKGSLITFGPLGKQKGCFQIKNNNSSYILFLNPAFSGSFHWSSFNPIKASSKNLRLLRKLLCENCLVAPSFKKESKVFKKKEGTRLKIKCKSMGKPRPTMAWYHEGQLLSIDNPPKDIIIKVKKKGGSSSLEIKQLDKKYHATEFICRASNPVSSSPANFTATVTITGFLGGTACYADCPSSYRHYCIEGKCCSDSGNQVHCRCYGGFKGPRCGERENPEETRQFSVEYRSMQRLIAVLGMCLALMLVLFLCFAVYCFFKRSRTGMHKKMLRVEPASPLMKESYNRSSLVTPENHVLSQATADSVTPGATHTSDEEPNHFALEKKLSRNSMNGGSKRSRLGGMARNEAMQSASVKRLVSSQNNSPLPIPAFPKLSNSAKINDEIPSKESPGHMHRPDLPIALGLKTMVDHVSRNSSATNSPTVAAKLAREPQTETDGRKLSEKSLSSCNSRNQTVTTFCPDGNVREETYDRGDGSRTVTSDVTSPEGLQSGAPASTASHHSLAMTSSSPPLHRSLNANNSNNATHERSYPYPAHTSTSDNEDLFNGVDIPDMSLSLYSNTPDHSLKKSKVARQNALKSDEYYVSPSATQPGADISSAERHKLPLLSKHDFVESTDSLSISLSSKSSKYENESDSDESHKILV